MAALLLSAIILLSPPVQGKTTQKNKPKKAESGWVIYFLPLQEFPSHTSLQYMRELGVILRQSKDKSLKKWKIPKVAKNDLKEPVFNRIEWNRAATELNQYCLKSPGETCSQLAIHRRQYMVRYHKFISDRKKWRDKKLKPASPKK